jgi:D-alanyl-D-alanine carboxypeptidase
VGLLVGEGRLSLDDTVERWLPGRVPNGENVTLRQLLTHTGGQELVHVTDWSPSYAWSAGAIVSTADDTAAFYRALLTGHVLRRDLLAQMKTTVPIGAGEDENYGMGLWHTRSIATVPGARLSCGAVWGHDGDLLGYHGDAFVRADRKRVVVLLGTYSKDEYDQSMLQAKFDVLEAALCGEVRRGNG